MPFLLILAANLGLWSVEARSEVVMRCKEPKGHIHAIGHGWFEDGFTNGEFSLALDGDNIDIFITDAVGSRSAKADGAELIVSDRSDDSITIAAIYPAALETYLFDFSRKEMIFSSMKISPLPSRGGIYWAICE